MPFVALSQECFEDGSAGFAPTLRSAQFFARAVGRAKNSGTNETFFARRTAFVSVQRNEPRHRNATLGNHHLAASFDLTQVLTELRLHLRDIGGVPHVTIMVTMHKTVNPVVADPAVHRRSG